MKLVAQEELLALAKLRAKEEHLEQSTALRQLLYLGAEGYVISLVESGRVSIGRAAELLKISVQDIHQLAEKQGVHLGATREQQKKSTGTLKRLLKKGV
ncbi:MAG: hypothetical protein V1644_03275 [Candidatus Micrarchaeota archaeon]